MGETPLHLACRSCQADIVGQLISFVKSKQGDEVANSYVNSVNEDGASALHYAANIKTTEVDPAKTTNDAKVIKLLFEGGADINIRTKQASLPNAFNNIIILLVFHTNLPSVILHYSIIFYLYYS